MTTVKTLFLGKNYLLEKLIFLVLIIAAVSGFWYFEEAALLKFFVILLGLVSVFLVFRKKEKKAEFSSRLEFPSLLILYLGIFTLYDFIYSINLPLYIVMIVVLALVSVLLFVLLTIDQADELLSKPVFRVFTAVMGIVILELFLSLYFWPLSPEVKSSIIVVVFYLIISLIYLYIHNVLRLKKVVGFLVVSLAVLIIVLLSTWLYLPR